MAQDILALLRITYADGHEQVVPLRQSTIGLGRIPPNEMLLPDPRVSRYHARLSFELDRIWLLDLDSANGTFVGGTRLFKNEPYPLSFGEDVTIGPFTLRLERVPKPEPEVQIKEEPISASPQIPTEAHVGVVDMLPPLLPPSGLPPLQDEAEFDAHAFGLPSDASRYMQYLPPLYQEEHLLGRFLLGFESVLLPIEQTVDHFDLYLDPATTLPGFLDRLAGWLGLTLDEKWPLEKRRTLVAEAVELYRRRGTRRGLARHLEIYTGLVPEISEPAEQPFHFEVVLRVPPGCAVDRTTVERIIQANQPAHTTYSLKIRSEANQAFDHRKES